MLVHCSRGTTAVAHSKNHRCTTANNVATGIKERNRRLHVLVHGNGILAAKFKSLNRCGYKRIGRNTHSHNSNVNIYCLNCALNRNRRTTA